MSGLLAFSILERIDVGETTPAPDVSDVTPLLSVSSNGSTWVKLRQMIARIRRACAPFSILERIDVGETLGIVGKLYANTRLSVSSNGSTWVKRSPENLHSQSPRDFQYPRTDRRG